MRRRVSESGPAGAALGLVSAIPASPPTGGAGLGGLTTARRTAMMVDADELSRRDANAHANDSPTAGVPPLPKREALDLRERPRGAAPGSPNPSALRVRGTVVTAQGACTPTRDSWANGPRRHSGERPAAHNLYGAPKEGGRARAGTAETVGARAGRERVPGRQELATSSRPSRHTGRWAGVCAAEGAE